MTEGQPVRVLHTESSRSLGGQELRILIEMEQLVPFGIESILAARAGTPIVDEARRRGLVVYELPLRSSVDISSMARLAKIMRKHSVDIVNAHGSKDAWNAALVARLLGRKVVRSRHVANPIRATRLGRLIYGPLCDRILTTSESIKQGMVERGVSADKIVSIPTGVQLERFSERSGAAVRVSLGVPADAQLVGMVSVLRGDKGPDMFVKAADQLLSEGLDAWFLLVGDGWMRAKLEAMIAASQHRDRILLPGYRRDIPELFAALNLFVLSAKVAEGVPQAVLQAHASHVPVVASEVGGVTEVAISERTARTVPAGDVRALASAIRSLLEAPDCAALLAQAGYDLVKSRYTLEGMLSRMRDFYAELAA